MEIEENSQPVSVKYELVLMLSVAILFFFQGARELIGTTYNFNLSTMSINISIVAVFAFLSPIIYPLVLRRLNQKQVLLFSGVLMIISRTLMSLGLDAGIYLAAAFVLVSASLIFFVAMAHNVPEKMNQQQIPQIIVLSGILGVCLEMVFRAAGGSFDISINGFFGIRATSLSIALPVILLFLYGLRRFYKKIEISQTMKIKAIFGMNLGLLLFIYMTFSGYPNVNAGWTSMQPYFSYIVTAAFGFIFLLLCMLPKGQKWLQEPLSLFLAEIMLAITFMLIILEPTSSISAILLPASIFPLIIIFSHSIKLEPAENKNNIWLSMLLAGFTFMIFVFISVLTLTWAHVPGTTFLKDKIDILALLAVFGIVLFTNIIHYLNKHSKLPAAPEIRIQKIPAMFIALALLCSCILPMASSDMFRPISESGTGTLTMMTYNIHQGYGMDGILDPWEILKTIEEIDPDILVLQESETNRLSSMNVDILNWLAYKLQMYVYSGPPTGEQIYGLALLSKYEIETSELYYLESIEDQRAWFRCQVTVNNQNIAIYGIHMGLSPEDRTSQSNEVIDRLANERMAFILMGDFNTWPNETIYQNLTSIMHDSWTLAGHNSTDPAGYTFNSPAPYERIDYIFVPDVLSRRILTCDVLTGQMGSDHLPVWATMSL